jgi:hypothetical protein
MSDGCVWLTCSVLVIMLLIGLTSSRQYGNAGGGETRRLWLTVNRLQGSLLLGSEVLTGTSTKMGVRSVPTFQRCMLPSSGRSLRCYMFSRSDWHLWQRHSRSDQHWKETHPNRTTPELNGTLWDCSPNGDKYSCRVLLFMATRFLRTYIRRSQKVVAFRPMLS